MLRLVPLLLAAACAAFATLPKLAEAAPVPADFYGINSSYIGYNDPSADWDRDLRSMRSLGFTELRRDAPWSHAQPRAADGTAGRYDFAEFDRYAAALARHGLRWYPLLQSSPAWAALDGKNWFSRPAETAPYAAYARAFAARYGARGSFWSEHPQLPYYPTLWYEIWNEPDFDRFWKEQDDAPERYADLALAATAAIKSVDPTGKVAVGVLARPDPRFITRMAARQPQLLKAADAVAVHTYYTLEQNLSGIADVRREVDRLGAHQLPLIISEVGYSTARGAVTEAYRASALSQFVATLAGSDCRVAKIQPYVWRSNDVNPDEFDNWWGIANADGSPKPTALALSAVIRSVPPARRVCYPALRVKLRLARKKGRLVLSCRANQPTRSPCRIAVRARYRRAMWRSLRHARPPRYDAPAQLSIRLPLRARFTVRAASGGQRASDSIRYRGRRYLVR